MLKPIIISRSKTPRSWTAPLLVICIVLFFMEKNQAQTPINAPKVNNELKILSWNIYMLPPLIFFNGKRKRADAIGEILSKSDYDVLVFQEAFHPSARRRIWKALKDKFPYEIGPANRNVFSLRASSGVWILSKIPIQKLDAICFKKRARFDNRMARKGALMVELEQNGLAFQIIGTHLNAGGSAAVRLHQVQQIADELLTPYTKQNVAQIICGDFNIEKTTDTYVRAIAQMNCEDGEFSGDQKYTYSSKQNDLLKGSGQAIIDYIFNKNNGLELSLKRKIPTIQKRWHKHHKDLADHQPVEAIISW